MTKFKYRADKNISVKSSTNDTIFQKRRNIISLIKIIRFVLTHVNTITDISFDHFQFCSKNHIKLFDKISVSARVLHDVAIVRTNEFVVAGQPEKEIILN